jgi:hypothetical protein
MTRGLLRRLGQVESALVPRKQYRIVMRYEGPGSERFTEPTEAEIRVATQILNIKFVSARDGRPESGSEITEGRT